MRIRKAVFIVFILFGTLSGLCAFAKGDFVIGDSTFSTDSGEGHFYKVTYSTLSMRKVGDMEKLSTPAIYADVHEGKDSMIVNFTAEYYNSTSGPWTTQNNNQFYCAYNYKGQ